jgi:hypothetical protein
MENFFGGVTTAHGINQVFKEFNGPVRRLFWLCAFAACFYFLFFLIIDTIIGFLTAATATLSATASHAGDLPMLTVCNLSPIRCGCEAFYDPAVLADDALLAAVLPFVCAPLVAFKAGEPWDRLDASGGVSASAPLEDAAAHVDLAATRARMAAFNASFTCDSGGDTAAGLVARLRAGTATLRDVHAYAGYAVRDVLVRGCVVTDGDPASPTLGRRVSCLGPEWWGNATFDPRHGACHPFNPCLGFPVGARCAADADCAHATDAARAGGRCAGGRCACSRCAAGAGCRVARQGAPGRGQGVRLVGSAAADQDPALGAAMASRWTSGLLVRHALCLLPHSVSLSRLRSVSVSVPVSLAHILSSLPPPPPPSLARSLVGRSVHPSICLLSATWYCRKCDQS